MAIRDSLIKMIIIASVFVVGALAFSWFADNIKVSEPAVSSKSNTAESQIGGPFNLVDQDGNPVTDQTYSDKYKLVYFGFTNCPMMCPTDLAVMSDVLTQLDGLAEEIYPLFITVDPERDDVKAMKSYTSNFHPNIQGLSGTTEQITDVALAYKIFYKKVTDDELDGGYGVNHSGYMYLMDKEGNYVTHFNHGQPAEEIIAGLRKYL